MNITVVICTYNRAEGLIRALESLLLQTLSADVWDVLVVNNNSKDDTLSRFDSFVRERLSSDTSPKMRIVTESNQGLSYARNRGISDATGDFIVFIDDDQEVSKNYLQSYYENCSDKGGFCIAGGPVIPIYEGGKPRWASKYSERTISGYLEFKGSTRFFPKGSYPTGGNMGFSSDVFAEYGGFSTNLGRTGDSLLGGEESDLFRRIASQRSDIIYLNDAKVYHHIPASRTTIAFLRNVSLMVGVSERLRTSNSINNYVGRIISEIFKWGATLCLSLLYTIRFTPSKGYALILMRKEITLGLLNIKNK